MRLGRRQHERRERTLVQAALAVLEQAVGRAGASLAARATLSKCNISLGRWEAALTQAEHVLSQDPHNLKAGLGKAESLFNTCRFEHALLQYSRGQVRMVETPSASGMQRFWRLVLNVYRDINSSLSH